MPETIPNPWRGFLEDLDAQMTAPAELHCFGGFVIDILYGLPRKTGDIDALSISPREQRDEILKIAGKTSALFKKHGLFIDLVTVAPTIDHYETRMTALFERQLQKLRIFALDPYDVALEKIERNSQKDRDDVKLLARTVRFDLSLLRARYKDDVRPYLGNPEREDLTLKLWIKAIEEERRG